MSEISGCVSFLLKKLGAFVVVSRSLHGIFPSLLVFLFDRIFSIEATFFIVDAVCPDLCPPWFVPVSFSLPGIVFYIDLRKVAFR